MADPSEQRESPPPDWAGLIGQARQLGAELSPVQVCQLERYLAMLRDWNHRFNLTAIDDPGDVLTKHFLDSLSCCCALDIAGITTLADVGTGAGFPGLVLKIAYPHLQVTLIDAVQKRLGFLDRVIAELGLADVRTLHARAEDAAATRRTAAAPPIPCREGFDLVTARAVARLNVLAEWLLPLARVDGRVLAMKGPAVAAEVADAVPAIRRLGGGSPTTLELTLPGTDIGRSLVIIPKLRPTPPEFPRLPGAAKRAPIR